MLSDQIDGAVTLTNTGYETAAGDQAKTTDPNSIGDVTLYGGIGNDTINVNAFTTGRVTVFGGAGNDNILGSPGVDAIFGGEGNDTILGAAGQDFLFGEAGNDVVNGQGATDVVSGGLGDDVLTGEILREELDVDLALSTVAGVHHLLGAGNDTLSASFVAAQFTGGPSANVFNTSLFAGGATLAGAGGNDMLQGGAFSDILIGGDGNDSLAGAGGNDVLFGDTGDDSLQGGMGNDMLRGGFGGDSFNGNDGDDRVAEQGNTDFVLIGMQLSSPLLGTDIALNVERFDLTGGSGPNLLDARQSSVPVTLNGGNGPDTLLGSAFADSLNGGGGNDVLSGGAGQDVLAGGLGQDIVYEKANANFTINGNQLTSAATGNEAAVGIEGFALVGGVGANLIDAHLSAVAVMLLGGAGNDTLIGSDFADFLVGGSRTAVPPNDGTDSLDGGLGADGYDNDPLDSRLLGPGDLVLADVFASLPSWLNLV